MRTGAAALDLVWEVTNSPIIVGWRVLKASAVSYGKMTSYLPFIDLEAQDHLTIAMQAAGETRSVRRAYASAQAGETEAVLRR